jgi:hypothetical protein
MAKTSKVSKKETHKHLEIKLEMTLATLVPVIGKKDFKRRVKKAGKVLTKGLKNRKSEIVLQRLKKLDGIEEDTAMRKKDRLILG